MQYWLLKSEPNSWSWEQQVEKDVEHWDGVRNYQAANNMKAMKIGDLAFFYHSNQGREIVGIVKIVREYYPDPSDESGRFGMVDVQTVRPVQTKVSLKEMKENPDLKNMALIKQSRLSVCPVAPNEWKIICRMAETALST
jgi:predicted RNA-binding protein with PUA-like domain